MIENKCTYYESINADSFGRIIEIEIYLIRKKQVNFAFQFRNIRKNE
jgi:hypothetical protein